MSEQLHYILDSAEGLASGRYGSTPYSETEFRDAIADLAAREARDGEGPERALVRLIKERDPRLGMLARAADFARAEVSQDALSKRRADLEAGNVFSEAVLAREALAEELQKRASAVRQGSETIEQAYVRLLNTDAEARALYAKHRAL